MKKPFAAALITAYVWLVFLITLVENLMNQELLKLRNENILLHHE